MAKGDRIHERLEAAREVKGSSNRSFGFVIGAVLAIIALVPLLSEVPPRWWLLGVQSRSSRSRDRLCESGGRSAGILARKAERLTKPSADSRRGGTSRATGLPRSVINTSCPARTSSSRPDRFCRASRIPAILTYPLCYK